MSTLHARGRVVYGLPPGPGIPGAGVTLWDTAGPDPGTPIWTGVTNQSGDFDDNVALRNFTGSRPKLDGSGHWEHPRGRPPYFVPDMETFDIPHVAILEIQVSDRGHLSPHLPYVAMPDALPAAVVPAPWGPPPVSLPQDEVLPALRTERLALARRIYEIQGVTSFPGAGGVVFDPPIPMFKGLSVDNLPVVETPPPAYLAGRTALQANIMANRQLVDRRGEFTILDDYRQMYPLVSPPRTRSSFADDEEFAAQRLAGVHPIMLRQVEQIPADFGVDRSENEPIISALIGERLATALSKGRLYMLDYEILAGVQAAHDAHDGRRLPVPYALFYFRQTLVKPAAPANDRIDRPAYTDIREATDIDRALLALLTLSGTQGTADAVMLAAARAMGPLGNPGQELVAIAIQVDRGYDAAANPVVTPASGHEQWARAKLMVQVADLNLHEMGAHLWAAHFAMEAFAVTMHRNLDVNHPLHELLKHHFAELLWNNHLGIIALVNEGGRVDRLLGTPLAGSMEILKRARQRWAFDPDGFEADLRSRRMDDYPGTYPYRDDGRSVRDAIATYVSEYVDLYYADDSRVVGDGELMHWLAELRKWQVAGTPVVATVGDLKGFITQVIFTSSAYHAAVNYAQYDFMGFIPNMPGAAYANPNTEPASPANTPPEDQLLPFYPPTEAAKDQVDLVRQLAGYQADRLGDYASQLADPAARTVADRFRAALADLENAMIQENASRRPALNYYYLCPDLVPNSTSV